MAERLHDWLAAQPFALAMSSGFFSFFAHTGMLSSLAKSRLAPNLVAGSSAGALVGGAWAAGLDPDALLRQLLPTSAMTACRVPVRISAFDIARRTTAVLHDADLADAIRASCAVPALFHPVWIARRAYWDGGILDRPGLAGVPVGQRVLFHHIASKSPWRTRLDLPRRAGMVTLVIDRLPRSGPFRLDAGRRALELARDATLRALDAPIVDGVVRVEAMRVAA